MGATRIGMRRGQQGIDQINAGFDSHHHPRLEHAGEAQVRVALGPLPLVALLVAHDAADIVYLQPEQVSYAMREKYAGNADLKSGLPGQLGQTHALHDIAQNAVRGQMHVAVIAPGDDLAT